ncbi:MAG: sodium:solute symporter [Acidobacteria bacterium]|nr:sodium:solute symporter [Acidobacteriota bacterium]
MRPVDWIVLAVSLAGIIGYGLYRARGSTTVESYLLAGRTMRWWVIGLSIMATQASAITFIGTTGQGYIDGLRFVQFYFGLPIAMVIISAIVVPRFFRANVYTAYEYLETKFDSKTRTMASLIFLIQRGLGVGLALYAPSVVLSVIMGWPEPVTIATMGALVITYTVIGGIKAVMWTDAQQMIVMLAGIVAAFLAAVWGLPPDISFFDAIHLAGISGKMQAVDLDFDWQNRYNLWSGLIGGSFLALSYFGTDQSQVQRYLTGKSILHMRISLLFNAVVKVPLQFVILLTGALVFSFFVFVEPPLLFNPVESARMEARQDTQYAAIESRYQSVWVERSAAARRATATRSRNDDDAFVRANQELSTVRQQAITFVENKNDGATYNDTNYIFLRFVLGYLPAGLVGLVIAAVFAAAMSTISAELNSLATVTVIDHYRRYMVTNRTDGHYTRVAKISTAFWGIYATVFASFGGQLGSLIEAVNIVGSLFYGSMLGVFVLAFAPWGVSGRGAFTGMLAGLAAVAWTASATDISFLWFNLVGCIVTVIVGCVVGRPRQALA